MVRIWCLVSGICYLLFNSCTKDLDQTPLSTSTAENFYTSEIDFILARNAVYSSALHGIRGNSYGYPDRLMNLSETRSDNLYAVTDGARDWEGINGFHSTIAVNGYVAEAYEVNYNAIYKANQLLEKLDENGEVITNAEERDIIRAEARFLRAFCYFDLVRWFGKVPLLDRTVTADEIKTIGRSPVEDIYGLILEDLAFAAETLPESYDAEDTGRATRYAAKGILALVHMTRSSPDYGIEGPGLGLDEWDLAYQQLNDIKASGLFAMEEKYSDIFAIEDNDEVVFDVQYLQETGAGTGASFVWVLTPDEYFRSIGLSAQGANYRRPLSNEFRSVFDPDDLRLQHSVIDTFTYDGTFYDYPFYVKYVDDSRYGDGRTDWGVNFIVLRYTDVLMLMAECALHGGGGSQEEIDAIVNQVRERAGLDPSANGVTLDELFEERRKEFCAEGTRWFDLYRTGKMVEIINAWDEVEDNAGRMDPFNENYILYPIPIGQMNIVPGLYEQNPGY